jgi:hypothetical protein
MHLSWGAKFDAVLTYGTFTPRSFADEGIPRQQSVRPNHVCTARCPQMIEADGEAVAEVVRRGGMCFGIVCWTTCGRSRCGWRC